MSTSVANLKIQQVAKLDAITATRSPLIRGRLEVEHEDLEVQINQAEGERDKMEITEDDIKAFTREAKKVMEHPAKMLLNPTNTRVQQALFGLAFETMPTYADFVNGTPKLNWVFKLADDSDGPKNQDVPKEGVEPS